MPATTSGWARYSRAHSPSREKVKLFKGKREKPSAEAKERIARKAAHMLHRAFRTRLLSLIDPSVAIRKVYDQFKQLPDVDRLAPIYIGAGQFYRLETITDIMRRKLRTVRDLIDEASECSERIDKFNRGIMPTTNGLRITNPEKILKDVQALQANFPKLIVKPGIISVTTEPIVLHCEQESEDVNLGRMRITLRLLHYCRGSSCYTPYVIEAEDGVNPKNGDDFIHPHVASGVLCEGNAQHAITDALDDGRFYDFFHIVHNTLIVYNEESPHCSLELWLREAETCSECGDDLNEDYSSSCEICGERFCDDCIRYCDIGSTAICVNCRNNASPCEYCEVAGSRGCLIHENDPCDICGEVPSDAEEIECDAGYTMHANCINDASTLPSMCVDCSYMRDCSELPESLKEEEEDDDEDEVSVEDNNDS